MKKKQDDRLTMSDLKEAVFERRMAIYTQLYSSFVVALNETNASEATKAGVSAAFEEAMSLRRRLFSEKGDFTDPEVLALLPDNAWLACEAFAIRSAIEQKESAPSSASSGELEDLIKEGAERIRERKKNM